jgi:phosphate acetyltransferase
MNRLDIIEEFKGRARMDPRRIALPEAEDERFIKATDVVVREGIARPILLGNKTTIVDQARRLGISLDAVELIEPSTSPWLEEYVSLYCQTRKVREGVARRILRRPLFYAAMMVCRGDTEGMVGGAVYTSADLIAAAELTVGLKEGISVPSSFFIMDVPRFPGGEQGCLIFADAAVNPDPTAEELADIAITTAISARELLGWEPRLAMLSFSTQGSAVHPRVDKVVEATKIAKEKSPDLQIDGELQADAALIPEVAARKVTTGSEVAGRANILIFPDLDAGNIGYKLTQWLAGAKAYGPILQGFRKPVSDLSRGASVEDIVGVIAITVVKAQRGGGG